MRKLLYLLAVPVMIMILAFAVLMLSRPPLMRVMDDVLPAGDPAISGVRVSYFGISTLLVSDGETDILIDGYFTRLDTPLDAVFDSEIASDPADVGRSLEAAGIEGPDAILVQHSHFDHALDAPSVAARTGAILLGSPSTLNIARGAGLAEGQLRAFTPEVPVMLGAFTLHVIPSRHVALPVGGDSLGRTIDAPLPQPARLWDYVEGGTYAFLLEHPLGSILFHGSAGWREGQYDAIRADVLLLGIGGLDARDGALLDDYVSAVADASAARTVIPIHFEDLFSGPEFPRLPMRAMGDAGRLLDGLKSRLPGRFHMLAYGRPTLVLPSGVLK